MKRNIYIVASVLIVQLFSSCKDQTTSPESFDDLHFSFVSGSIGANLMPSVPPDPIGCQIILLAENKNQTNTISNLSIPQADVFLDSSDQRLGTITFTTNWDGRLGPMERDTVYLTKIISQTSLFSPQCNKYVYLKLLVQNDFKNSITFKTDSLFFGCVY
jgi:hypothetical protein